MKTQIYLRRKRKLILDETKSSDKNIQLVATILKNIESLGFTFSSEIIEGLQFYTPGKLIDLYAEIIPELKKLVGAHVEYKPMYPNFPTQVINAEEAELYMNAILHYVGDAFNIRILPSYSTEKREELKDKVKLKAITLGTEEDFNSIFTNLVSAKTSISEQDKEDLIWYVKENKEIALSTLPNDIPLKENVALLAVAFYKYTTDFYPFSKKYCKTATDLLRVIVALSDGDISLAENTKFKNYSRPLRKLFLSFLEEINNPIEDMLRYKEVWKRVGEKLHPREYKDKFPKATEAFSVLRNDTPYATFANKIEKDIQAKNINELVSVLKSRPGEFARKLDFLLRSCSSEHDSELVLETFKDIAANVSTPVLLQLYTHLKNRNQKNLYRTFFPKGNVSKVQLVDNNLPLMSEDIRQKAVMLSKNTLKDIYAKRSSLGKVYIDKNLKKYTVPFALRSASKALKSFGRGTIIDIPEGNTLRFFIWWKDGQERTDIDLSALALNFNHITLMQIAYYNLKELGGTHSGDITSAPDGASEFIDIDIEKFKTQGIRYVQMLINSYTQQPFCDLPECFAGFMMRQHPASGEIYDPRTIENKIDITSNTKICMPFIIDLEKRKMIWTDISLTSNPQRVNSAQNNQVTASLINKAMTSLVKPSLHELFTFQAEARGEIVEDKKEADIIFSVTEGITPFDTELIISDYL